MGTIGLILIVLEGALELESVKKKCPYFKGFLLLIILVLNIAAQWVFVQLFQMDTQLATLSAIPLAIISSAVAISLPRAYSIMTGSL